MWSSSPEIPAASLELVSIRIPISPSPSPSPTYSSEYEAGMIHDDHNIWKDGDGTCYYPSSKSHKDTWKCTPYQTLLSPLPFTRVEISQPTLSPYDTSCIAQPPLPSPCSPVPYRFIRPASTSPVRFTFTPNHILSSQRRAIILASKQSKQQQNDDIWHGDVSCYPTAPITLKLDKKWMTTSISAPQLTNVSTSTPSPEKTPIASTPTPIAETPTPVADATPIATSTLSRIFLTVPSSTPLLQTQDDRSTPFSQNSSQSITPSYTTPYTWIATPSSSSSTPLAPPTLTVRISISSPSPLPSTCPLAPRCLDPWITPGTRITPSVISSY